jgi:hypothetical protein
LFLLFIYISELLIFVLYFHPGFTPQSHVGIYSKLDQEQNLV